MIPTVCFCQNSKENERKNQKLMNQSWLLNGKRGKTGGGGECRLKSEEKSKNEKRVGFYGVDTLKRKGITAVNI